MVSPIFLPDTISDEFASECVGALEDLFSHPGYRILTGALIDMYDELVARLAQAADPHKMAQAQGSLRAVADIVEYPNPVTSFDPLRLRLIENLRTLQEQRTKNTALDPNKG